MPSRPLSPHLSVYKFKYTLLSSILNRAASLALSVGLIALTYWLLAVAGGARAQAQAQAWLATPLMKLFLAALVLAFCYHLVAGIRHLVWDTGRGLERAASQRSAWVVGVVSLLLTFVLGYCLFRCGHAP